MVNGWELVPVCKVKYGKSANNEKKYTEYMWTVYFKSKLFQSA